jgi:hypothetical protein
MVCTWQQFRDHLLALGFVESEGHAHVGSHYQLCRGDFRVTMVRGSRLMKFGVLLATCDAADLDRQEAKRSSNTTEYWIGHLNKVWNLPPEIRRPGCLGIGFN